MGYGVIGSPTGSGPVSLGSSPSTPASSTRLDADLLLSLEFRPLSPPLCSGLARRPLKAVAPVRIRSGVPRQQSRTGLSSVRSSPLWATHGAVLFPLATVRRVGQDSQRGHRRHRGVLPGREEPGPAFRRCVL